MNPRSLPSGPPPLAHAAATLPARAWSLRWLHGPVPRIICVALSVRVALAVLAFFAQVTIPAYQDQGFGVYRHRHAFWDNFARYDSGWYHGIARNGYRWVEGGRNDLAFFPAYPMAMRLVGRALGGKPADFYFGGIVVSWAASVIAMLLLYRLALLDLDPESAEQVVPFALLHPFAFFFGVVYAESLFLMAAVGAFYGFRSGAWRWGALSGALACITRVNGVMMLPALAWLAWRRIQDDRSQWPHALGALAFVPLGLIGYMGFCYALTGNPLEWMDSIRRWEYHPGGAPWVPLQTLVAKLAAHPYHYLVHGGATTPYDTLNGAAAILAVGLVPIVWWRLGMAYALFMIANLALPLSSGQYEGLGRYTSVLFPIALLGGSLAHPTIRATCLGLSATFHALCLALFVNVHPIF